MTGPPTGRSGVCLVVAAPSGAGKSTITRALLAADPSLTLSISVTTRAPRPGEQDGVHYLFLDDAQFTAMVEAGDLLESAGVFGRRYGTPRAPVAAVLAAGADVVFDIDWQGYRQLRAALPAETVGVFIMPPSIEALRERLRRRGDRPKVIEQRMQTAHAEMSHWREFDYLVLNDDVATATQTVQCILRAARSATSRRR